MVLFLSKSGITSIQFLYDNLFFPNYLLNLLLFLLRLSLPSSNDLLNLPFLLNVGDSAPVLWRSGLTDGRRSLLPTLGNGDGLRPPLTTPRRRGPSLYKIKFFNMRNFMNLILNALEINTISKLKQYFEIYIYNNIWYIT